MLQRRKPLRSGIKRAPERRWRKHSQWVRGWCCVAFKSDPQGCDGKVEAAHVRTGTDGGMSEKPSDWWQVPMCARHHREQHQIGEPAFERKYGVDMKREALRLAKLSPDIGMRQAMKEALS